MADPEAGTRNGDMLLRGSSLQQKEAIRWREEQSCQTRSMGPDQAHLSRSDPRSDRISLVHVKLQETHADQTGTTGCEDKGQAPSWAQ